MKPKKGVRYAARKVINALKTAQSRVRNAQDIAGPLYVVTHSRSFLERRPP